MIGAKVDALALMLDGAANDQSGTGRFERINVNFLIARRKYSNPPPLMERAVAQPEWAEVAEAILELEAWADWWADDNCQDCVPMEMSTLAGRAHAHAGVHATHGMDYADVLLEAAALLRDGWRPRGWKVGKR